jgi:hypothetical protein
VLFLLLLLLLLLLLVLWWWAFLGVLVLADVSPLGVSAAEAMSGEPANVAAKMLRTATLNFIFRSFQVVNGV